MNSTGNAMTPFQEKYINWTKTQYLVAGVDPRRVPKLAILERNKAWEEYVTERDKYLPAKTRRTIFHSIYQKAAEV